MSWPQLLGAGRSPEAGGPPGRGRASASHLIALGLGRGRPSFGMAGFGPNSGYRFPNMRNLGRIRPSVRRIRPTSSEFGECRHSFGRVRLGWVKVFRKSVELAHIGATCRSDLSHIGPNRAIGKHVAKFGRTRPKFENARADRPRGCERHVSGTWAERGRRHIKTFTSAQRLHKDARSTSSDRVSANLPN